MRRVCGMDNGSSTAGGMAEEFISQAIRPVASGVDTRAMATGAPGLPQEFSWRGEKIVISRVLQAWRETGPCRHGSGEKYVRRHWFEVLTAGHGIMRIYFERQSRGGRATARWWLFSRRAMG